MKFDQTWLWTQAFTAANESASTAEKAYFAQRYLSMREKAAALVSRISADLTDMTVHDITHLDALWEMASIVTRNRVVLNPPEAFVFGGAVLLHDAAMTLAAYPGGLGSLKNDVVWRDSYARILMELPDEHNPASLAAAETRATFDAIRKLHAVRASQLPTMAWADDVGMPEYLIDDPEVRGFYGQKIGQIAQSHWWNVPRIAEELSVDLGPLGGRTSDKVDATKIACLLRIADAMHLDQRRAPAFQRKLVDPSGTSKHHWVFQERMAVPYVRDDALIYSAAPPFERLHAASWWLAYDALTTVDRELREVDYLLQRTDRTRLNAHRVRGVASALELARHVETVGWEPVDSTVRVSDVPKIVATLGGSKLYGDNPAAAVRELIQNAADAVSARRRLQNRPDTWGEIVVSLKEIEEDEYELTVEDNGVGMSSAVLTGPLIDFGNSLWRSALAADEFPGLQASGEIATGKYGIGFFSVFMLGDQVRVTSRKYNLSSDSVNTLQFDEGLASRPILYNSDVNEGPVDGGTKVIVLLKPGVAVRGSLSLLQRGVGSKSMADFVGALAPNLSVRVRVIDNDKDIVVIEPNDWLDMEEAKFLSRVTGKYGVASTKAGQSRLRHLKDETGHEFGRAAIEVDRIGSWGAGCITVGGLRATEYEIIRGVLTGREQTAARDQAIPLAPPEVLASWATEQAKLLSRSRLSEADKARGAQVVLFFGGDLGLLPIARQQEQWLTSKQVSKLARENSRIIVIFESLRYDEDTDDVSSMDFNAFLKESDHILFVPDESPGLAQLQRTVNEWLDEWQPANLEECVRGIISKEWSGVVFEVEDSAVVGLVRGTEIERTASYFSREEGDDPDDW